MAASQEKGAEPQAGEIDFLVDQGKSVATTANRWLFVLAAVWLVVLLPLPNWMDSITQKRFTLWRQVADRHGQREKARGQYLLALLSLHIKPQDLDDITTERIFNKTKTQPSCARLPIVNSPEPLEKTRVAPHLAVISDDPYSEKYKAKVRCSRELIEAAAKEADVQEAIGESAKSRRLYDLLLVNPLEGSKAIGKIHRAYYGDSKGLSDYVVRVKEQYDRAQAGSETSKDELGAQKPGFEVAIPSFIGLPIPGNISAPAIICLWSLSSVALIIYLAVKRRILLTACSNPCSLEAPTIAHRFWWWLMPLPGRQGPNLVLLITKLIIVGALLAAHAYLMFLAIRFREWTAYFLSIPPSAALVDSSNQFAAVPLFVLTTFVCAVAASIYWWTYPPDSASTSAGPNESKRRFIRWALLVPVVGAAIAIANRYDFWTTVRYETLRKWWRRPRYKRRQVLTPVFDLKPGFYAAERDSKKEEYGTERVLHYVWDTQQLNGRPTVHLKSLLARRKLERWPKDKSWATDQAAASAASGNRTAFDGLIEMQPRHRKKRRPDPKPLSGRVIRMAHGIKVARLRPVDVSADQASERNSHVQLATASHSLEQHALSILMEGGDPQQAISLVRMGVELDRAYKEKNARPISLRLYDLLIGLSLRYSEAAAEDITYEFLDLADDAALQERAKSWHSSEWGRRWRNRKDSIRWAGVMLPAVMPHQVRDLKPSPYLPPAPLPDNAKS